MRLNVPTSSHEALFPTVPDVPHPPRNGDGAHSYGLPVLHREGGDGGTANTFILHHKAGGLDHPEGLLEFLFEYLGLFCFQQDTFTSRHNHLVITSMCFFTVREYPIGVIGWINSYCRERYIPNPRNSTHASCFPLLPVTPLMVLLHLPSSPATAPSSRDWGGGGR